MFRVHLSPPPTAALFPYTTLFRSHGCQCLGNEASVCSGRIRPFDIDVPTGEFVPAELGGLARQTAELSWYEFACRYIDIKWPNAAATYRRLIAETLASVRSEERRVGKEGSGGWWREVYAEHEDGLYEEM